MKLIYFFGSSYIHNTDGAKAQLGSKGFNLSELSQLQISIPQGFTISTNLCNRFIREALLSDDSKKQIKEALNQLTQSIGKTFASTTKPLLLSLRADSLIHVSGILGSILNLGMNDDIVTTLIQEGHSAVFVLDTYRRFIHAYSSLIKDVDSYLFEDTLEQLRIKKHYKENESLSEDDYRKLILLYKDIYKKNVGSPFLRDPYEQLWEALSKIYISWNSLRAKKYREVHRIPHEIGVAVNISSMIFGNKGNNSGSGVCTTRHPTTGNAKLEGQFLINAQGEDIFSGLRHPIPIYELKKTHQDIYIQLEQISLKLENYYKDIQEIEFSFEDGCLFILLSKNLRKSVSSSLKIAFSLAKDNIISKEEAIQRVNPKDLEKYLHPTLNPEAHKHVIAKGLAASPMAVSGRVAFSSREVEKLSRRGESTIFVHEESTSDDILSLQLAQGFLTARGGMTSHSAVIARQLGKCCITGCSPLIISLSERSMYISSFKINEGDWLTLDGSTGEVILGKVDTNEIEVNPDLIEFLQWTKEFRLLKVYANVDTPRDALTARNFAAEGIGLCRTEHMFFDEKRLLLFRCVILAKNLAEKKLALNNIRDFQRDDFVGILTVMRGQKVTIRLLDPPLHEFLPRSQDDIENLAKNLNISLKDLQNCIQSLKESNPMLGHRGCRLGISDPEIYEMQVSAIVEAASLCNERGISVNPEIMIPLISTDKEFIWLKNRLSKIAPKINFGAMIEVPRAALTAGKIAPHASFFSFGTNDLTQTVFGFSRDDSASFLKVYKQENILSEDPFCFLDEDGVCELIRIAVKKGKQTNPNLELGLCGEQSSEAESIELCHELKLNYVSCSPFRIPIAMLAAAQAALKYKK